MKFSDYFRIKRKRSEDWFDPVLSVDTPLFIDPFLIYAQEQGPFRGSHREIIDFFNSVFRLLARSKGKRTSVLYKKAVSDLLFPEVAEICLGYTAGGTRGSGSGIDLARVIAEALWEAIKAGLVEITHFEEIAILREGIGPDRISDTAANLLRRRLADYTVQTCKRHGVTTELVSYVRGYYDVRRQGWLPISVRLPLNPYNQKPVLLVPQRYLKDLPTVNAYDFWNYSSVNESETIRNEFSYDVTRRVRKKQIIELARRHPEIRRNYLEHLEKQPARPYDVTVDRRGYLRWYNASKSYCQSHPVELYVQSVADFEVAVYRMVQEYVHFVEQNEGWRLLWNDDLTSKSEKAAQLLMLGIVKHYCQANNIDISREADIGRGPVDFKVSKGYGLRVLLEMKLARNSRFWNGLRNQLPTYMKAEKVTKGYFVVVVFSKPDFDRVKEIRKAVEDVKASTGNDLKVVVVDAQLGRPSASKV